MGLNEGTRVWFGGMRLFAVFFACWSCCQHVSAQSQDTSPPQLLSFTFSPTTIDVTGGPQNVTVTYTASDDLSGVQASGALNFSGPSGQNVQGVGTEVGRSGNPEVVTYQGTVTFQPFIQAGVWQVRHVPLSDRAGNFTSIDLTAQGFPTDLAVASTSDSTPPQLLSFSFSPTCIDTSGGPQSVVVTYTASDDLSGVQTSGALNFGGPSGQNVQGIGTEVGRSGNPEVVAFQGTATFPQFSAHGVWPIRHVPLSDRAGNFTSADVQSLGFPTDLTNGPHCSTLATAAKLWVGLKNSDDQGTQFDLRAELYINDTLWAEAETRCVTGITRNPAQAKEVTLTFGSVSEAEVGPDDVLSLRVLTRIGTNPDGSKCAGHSNAVGLRLYYDAVSRHSRFGAQLPPDPLTDYFLHSSAGDLFLDSIPPTSTQAKQRDSGPLNFKKGNAWAEIGTWTRVVP